MKPKKIVTFSQANHLLAPGTATSLAFVVTDILIDAYIMHHGDLLHQVFYSDPRELSRSSLAPIMVFACTVTVWLMTLHLPATGGPVALCG